jgi:hypothetical protein
MGIRTLMLAAGLAAAPTSLVAQHRHHDPSLEPPPPNRAVDFLFAQGSGTAVNPSAWDMPMLMDSAGRWRFMWMGQAYAVATRQSGPRGRAGLYSPNWAMLAAVRPLDARSALLVRGMLSLEPLTVRGKRYPLLFQTGETADGRPIVDGQHPHDLFMEIGVQYARALGSRGMLNLYYAPVGDAALGPIAFPHRASAVELPQATLGHHWADSTHIATQVLTAALSWRGVRIEASAFHGREPDENRWNVDLGGVDSWSLRGTFAPSRRWLGQVSVGRLEHPEATHDDDVVRVTASVHHVSDRPSGRQWSTSAIWARNHKTVHRLDTHAVTIETAFPLGPRDTITGRLEWSQRDELFEYDHQLAERIAEESGRRAFPVAALTVGYTRDLRLGPSLLAGIGSNLTLHAIDRALEPFYGRRPWGASLFVKLRLDRGR